MALLNSAAIPPVLRQISGDGVEGVMLLHKDEGSILSSIGGERDAAAIAAVVCSSYSLNSQEEGDSLQVMMLHFENMNIGSSQVGEYLICAYGSLPLGLLKMKLAQLYNYLQEPLLKI